MQSITFFELGHWFFGQESLSQVKRIALTSLPDSIKGSWCCCGHRSRCGCHVHRGRYNLRGRSGHHDHFGHRDHHGYRACPDRRNHHNRRDRPSRRDRLGPHDRHGFFSIFSDSNRVSNKKIAFQGSKELQSSKYRSSRLLLVLGGFSLGLETVPWVVSFLVTVETDDMTQVLASPTGNAGNVGGIDIGGWGGTSVVSGPLVFQATLFLLLFPNLLVGGLADRKDWGREECCKERGSLFGARAFLDSLSQGSRVNKAWIWVFLERLSWESRGQRWSISLRMEGGWRLSIAFWNNAFQLSSSLPRCSF